MKIAVFCSANNNIDADFFTLTEELGRWMGENGHTLVYGGCDSGLMKAIGDSVHMAGGMVIGVVPRIIELGGKQSPILDVHIPCENLSDRKDIMLLHADLVIALPGGIGTLDEIFTVAAGKTIGYHQKPLALYNMKGFWNSTLAMLDDLQSRQMIRGHWRDMIKCVENLKQLQEL